MIQWFEGFGLVDKCQRLCPGRLRRLVSVADQSAVNKEFACFWDKYYQKTT